MNKWIFLIILYSSVCYAQNPPFSEIYRRPSLSSYLQMNPDLNLNYNNCQRDAIILERQRQLTKPPTKPQYYYQRPIEPDTIRQTGHPTYFMYIPYYNFK